MSVSIIDIAEAVKTELAGASFGIGHTTSRQALPAHDLRGLSTTDAAVTVAAHGVDIEAGTRAMSRHNFQIDIGVQRKIDSDLDAEVDELCALVAEIAAFLRRRPLASVPGAAWVHTANEPVYSPEHLSEQRVFTSVLTVTYRVLQ